MANSDKDIRIITNRNKSGLPNISFTGYNNDPIVLNVLDDNTISFEGSSGQLFSVSNAVTTGTIFSVNDISGIPSFRIDADGTVGIAEFSGNVGIGLQSPQSKLSVGGDINASIGYSYRINGTMVLNSSSLGTGVTLSSLTSVGTISSGTWQGSSIGVLYGGTGATNASDARSFLGAATAGTNSDLTRLLGVQHLYVTIPTAAAIGITVKGATSQSASMMEFVNSSNTLLAWITKDGTFAHGAYFTHSDGRIPGFSVQKSNAAGIVARGYNSANNAAIEVQDNPGALVVGLYPSGLVYGGVLQAYSSTASTNTTTGALIVAGGAGIAATVNIGRDLRVFSSLASSSPFTGALVVSGGAGISNNLYVGGGVAFTASIASTSATTGTLVVTGGVGIGGTLFSSSSYANSLSGVVLNNGSISLTGTYTQSNSSTTAFSVKDGSSTTAFNIDTIGDVISLPVAVASSSTGTGSLVVAGGVGIGGSVYVGGRLTVSNTIDYVANDSGIANTWTRIAIPSPVSISGLTYGNGLYVGVGYSAATSTDGITWTARTLPHNLTGVGYGNGLYVGVLSGSALGATSTDGITWRSMSLPSSTTWLKVAYGNGVYVANADSLAVAYSFNGFQWTSSSLYYPGGFTQGTPVEFGGGYFIIRANAQSAYWISNDGINWTYRTNFTSSNVATNSIAYGDGVWVLAGSSASLAYTRDLLNFTYSSHYGWSGSFNYIAYTNGTFAIVDANSLQCTLIYKNLSSINASYLPGPNAATTITAGEGKFVAGAGSTVYVTDIASHTFNIFPNNSGELNNVRIGAKFPSSGQFTVLSSSGLASVGSSVGSTSTSTGALVVRGGVGIGGSLYVNSSSIISNVLLNSGVITGSLTGTATTATYSHQSGYGITAGTATTATYSHQSGYATTSGLATTANYAYQSGYGITAGLATTATYAYQCGYATTSGFATSATSASIATTSYSVNVNSASSSSSHYIIFSPNATGSGVALSTESALVYNPSTDILSVSGLAVTSSLGSTSTSTGALTVSGGVGIGGTLNISGNATIGGTLNVSGSNSYFQNNLYVGNNTQGRLYFSQATLGSAGTTVIPTMAFIGATNSPITLSVLPDNSLSFDGSSGQLFSINNNLSTGWIFSINDISGLPIFRTNADLSVAMGEYGGNVGIGLSNAVFKLQVSGNAGISGTTLISNTTSSTNTTTGALVVSGGVGIGGSLNVNSASSISSVTFNSGVVTGNLTGTATTATYSNQSGYGITAGLATTSTYSHQSGYATTSGIATTATYAYQSGYGITAGTATTATYSHQSGYATTSGIATTATYAYQSGYGITAGFATSSTTATSASTATTSYSVSVNSASTNANHYLIFSPNATGSGVALSTESSFVYNPSTDIFSVSGLAVTSSLGSTSTSTGALTVTGGVGIGGSLFIGNTLSVASSTASTSTSTGALIITGGVGIGQSLFTSPSYASSISGAIFSNGSATLSGTFTQNNTSTTAFQVRDAPNSAVLSVDTLNDIVNLPIAVASTTTGTGSLVVAGGAGIGGSANIGGRVGIGTNLLTGQINIRNSASTVPSVVIQGATSQSADYLRILSSTGTTSFLLNSSFQFAWPNIGTLKVYGTSYSSQGALQVDGCLAVSTGPFLVNTGGGESYLTSETLSIGGSIAWTKYAGTTMSTGNPVRIGPLSSYTYGLWINAENGWTSGTLLRASNNGSNVFTVDYAGNTSIASTTGSYSTTTGALVVTAGVGIGGSLYVASATAISGVTINAGVITGSLTGTASTATYSNQSGYAITSGIANTSYSVNANAASTNASHYLIFSPSASGSGVALSTESALVYNPSTDILSVSGLAITSGTASTNTTTGALVVRGGLGVTGQLSFATASFGFTGITSNPTMSFIGATTSAPITLTVLTDNSLSWEGTSGQLFSIDNNLSSGEIFSVSDISGLPIISASSGQTVTINEFGGFTRIGNGSINSSSTTSGSLQVTGGLGVTGNAFIGGTTSITNTTTSTSTSSGALVVSGGVGIGGSLYVASATAISGVTINAGVITGSLTGTATTSTYATQSGYAITSGTATTATYSNQSGYGITAGFADTSSYSYQSGYGLTSGLATTANYSHQAGYAITSGSSATATTATYAHQAGYGITAGSANSWTTPRTLNLSGDLSGSVVWSGSGDTTITATIAANSVALGTDTTGQYASTLAISGSGITVTTANADDSTAYTIYSSATSNNTSSTIVFRDGSGNFSSGTITASLTGTATTATYAHQAGYAITSGSSSFATTASNININSASAASAHFLNFSPVATGSGVAVSSNTTLSYNPSTLIMSTSGLAVTSSTDSTATSSGSLIVTGGVGIGGSASVGGRLQMFNGANYTAFVSSASGNTTYTLPATSPATGTSILQSTAAGVMSWVAMSAGGGGAGTVYTPTAANKIAYYPGTGAAVTSFNYVEINNAVASMQVTSQNSLPGLVVTATNGSVSSALELRDSSGTAYWSTSTNNQLLQGVNGGSIIVDGNGNIITTAPGYLSFYNSSQTFTTNFQSAATTVDQFYTLPSAYPATGTSVLASSTGGTMSWVALPTAGTANTVSSGTQYQIAGYYAGTGASVAGSTTFTNNTSTSVISISHATNSTSLSTGALVITGGVGIGKTVFLGDNLNLYKTSGVGAVRFWNAGNTFYTALQAGNPSANTTYSLPTSFPGTGTSVLQSDTSGTLSWVPMASGGSGTVTTLTAGTGISFSTGSTITTTGTIRARRPLTASFCAGYTPAASGADSVVIRLPDSPSDGTTAITYEPQEFHIRVETASATTTTIQLEKYTGTGAFSGTAITSVSISGGSTYEAQTSVFAGAGILLTSGDKLRINFTALSASHANFSVYLELEER